MKIKYIIILFCMLLICGCQNVKNKDITLITSKLATDIKQANTYRTGYKYYLPVGVSVKEYTLYNEILETDEGTFYLYVDLISYFNNIRNTYEVNNDIYYSASLNYEDKYGYIEINLQENDQYLIEIMFNYAKIEVMVDYDDINLALSHAVSILRSVEYKDNVIANLLGEDILNYQEEVYNIFNTTSSDSNYLKYIEEDELKEQEQENEIKDTDLIN
ncbi:MAG: hypothetical protein E7167_02845 [Firmicutes bacterium]|nr:hypothetical protein [Bacillota bacterium]